MLNLAYMKCHLCYFVTLLTILSFSITAFALDPHVEAVIRTVEGAKGKVTLLNGSEKTEVDLIPAGNKMEAKGVFKVGKGAKGIASVTLSGKSAAIARFEVK